MGAPANENSNQVDENRPDTVDAKESGGENPAAEQALPKITDFLDESRILLDFDTSSRKRLFETIAELSSNGIDAIEEDGVFKIIAERERLGCTGLGRGVAVPHGRIGELQTPLITLVRLKHPVDYDAPDNKPVWLAVALLVPEDANATHLKLLSVLAKHFQSDTFIESLKRCDSPNQVRQLFDQVA